MQVTTMTVFPTRRYNRRLREIGRSSSIRPRGAAPTSPPEGVLQHMRHEERVRVVGTHYGPTRIYGPTGHAIERHSRHSGASTADNAPGLGTISDDYGPAATCRSLDLAAAAGARATRMSQLWAGEAAGGRGPERQRATGPKTTRPPGAGRRKFFLVTTLRRRTLRG